jgi:hypothetical protein
MVYPSKIDRTQLGISSLHMYLVHAPLTETEIIIPTPSDNYMLVLHTIGNAQILRAAKLD